ncbi:NAD(P)-binding domain-containing protein [Candidatus Woesearchaeota archaeon]|nr:NAD(P)-binding domain-containing protein [Candidatus Woesearchaeota archaeon]
MKEEVLLAEIPLMLFLANEWIAVIGAGSIGEQVVEALYEKGHRRIIATRHSEEALKQLAQKYRGIETRTNNCYAVQRADVIVVATKPKITINEVGPEIAAYTKEKLVICLAAATSLEKLYQILGTETRTARVMTGLYVKDELAAYTLGENTTAEDRAMVHYIFGSDAIELEEKLLAHRTFIACDTGLTAKETDVKIEELVQEGMPRQQACLFYAAMHEALAHQLRKGISGTDIYAEVGGSGSFTRGLGTMLEETGFYELLRECVQKTVVACGGK